MIVLKFGGTSLSTKERINVISNIVKKNADKNPILVVSAISGVTDLLFALANATEEKKKIILENIEIIHIDLAHEIWGSEIPMSVRRYISNNLRKIGHVLEDKDSLERTDKLVSYGEIMSSHLIARTLKKDGIRAKQIIASSIIVTNEQFGSADFLPQQTTKKVKKVLLPLINQCIVPVVTGFVARTVGGKITTLGRGGSDYSAAIIGYSLGASEIQIWTDVDGILTADPKFIKTAKIIKNVSYKEASELATFGAKVLHPRTIRPAIKSGIPVRVLNTFNPKSSGTQIKEIDNKISKITAIASKINITMINLYSTDMLLSKGFLKRIFAIFHKYNISIDLVSVSEVSVSLTLDNVENLNKAIVSLSKFTSVTRTDGLGIISIIGENIVEVPNVMSDIFATLDRKKVKVRMISLGATDINISLVIDSNLVESAVVSLHDEILLDRFNANKKDSIKSNSTGYIQEGIVV